VAHGFNIVTANKIANTLSQDFYDQLRELLKEKVFEYETNVGAGLPIVETHAVFIIVGKLFCYQWRVLDR
jgi:aspartokinase/homoserine dehydrogenase 1